MPAYSKETISEVLAANDIVAIIGAVIELKPAGSGRHKARCPFHMEKTPSFNVSQDRQMFHCFGCGKSGDAIGFLREHEGLSFVEAVENLAHRAGVALPAMTERQGTEEHKLTQLLEFGKFAQRFFAQVLEDALKGGPGRRYLKTRQLKPETVKRFGLGFAQDDWTALTNAGRDAGFKDAVMEESGLVRRAEGGRLYDFFRNRLMFPISDVSGKVVAFGGRDLGDDAAKYINSPENPVYKKGRILYGLHQARDAVRNEKRAILVEGYFDLLRCFDAGIENVVATCGTALTMDQAALVHRYVREVVVVFDGDAAGIRAALKGIGILTANGLGVRALILPEGQDPDDYVKQEGPQALRERVETALDFVTFYVTSNRDRLGSIEGRTDVAREIFSILVGIEDELRRDEYLKRAARELGLNEWTARIEFGKFLRNEGASPAPMPTAAPRAQAFSQDDCDFIAVLLNKPHVLAEIKQALFSVELPESPIGTVLNGLLNGEGVDLFQRFSDEDARRLYAAAANNDRDLGSTAPVLVQKRLAQLRRESLRATAARLKVRIEEAERRKDTSGLAVLMAQQRELNREFEKVGAT